SELVRRIAIAGLGLNAVAAILGAAMVASGVASAPTAETAIWVRALFAIRLILVFMGTVTGGAAISMRAGLWWSWGFGVITSVAGFFGLPAHWDSFQAVFLVLAALCVAGIILRLLSPKGRIVVISIAIIFHFSGIFSAVTSPP